MTAIASPAVSTVASPHAAATYDDLPLVVDLDGTLIRSDTLTETLLLFLRRTPANVWRLPGWLAGGKVVFKRRLSDHVVLDAANLPYDARLLAHLQQERGRRQIVLCTGADERIAQAVAAHVGLFDGVMATTGDVNLTGHHKARALTDRFGTAGFDYAGNDVVDLAVFKVARHALVVNATPALDRRLTETPNVTMRIPRVRAGVREALRALRPHQWVKNLLVFVPMVAAREAGLADSILLSLAAFMAFSLAASSVYVVNDLMDLDSDRAHPRKKTRPLAQGTVSIGAAGTLGLIVLLTAFVIAGAVSPLFGAVIATYVVSSTMYTVRLKRIPLLDTMTLAGLYTLRIVGGAVAIQVTPSFWLLAFSMFFFLSLALAKRHSELLEFDQKPASSASSTIPGREYVPEDLHTLISQGSASGYAAVVVLSLYIHSDIVQSQYRNPDLIFLVCPLLLYWLNKLWLNSQRRQIKEDPLIWAFTNRVSRLIGALCVLVLGLAMWTPPFT